MSRVIHRKRYLVSTTVACVCVGDLRSRVAFRLLPLLNKNCAVDANERRRLANKRWRDNHPGYMAQKSREARQRRRLALETEGDAN